MSTLFAQIGLKPNNMPNLCDAVVDPDHPLAKGMVVFNPMMFPKGWYNCVQNKGGRITLGNNYNTFQKITSGSWWGGLRTTGYYGCVIHFFNHLFDPTKFSCLFVYRRIGATNSLTKVGFGFNQSGVQLIGIGFNSEGKPYAANSDGFGTNLSVVATNASPASIWQTAVATSSKGGKLRLYIDGIEDGTPVDVSLDISAIGVSATIGHNNAGFSSVGSLDIKLAIWWSGRELTAREVYSITKDPYQVLQPKTVLFNIPSGGGTAYTASLDLVGGAGYSAGSVAEFLASMSLVTDAIVSDGSVALFPLSLSFASIAGMTPTGFGAFIHSLTLSNSSAISLGITGEFLVSLTFVSAASAGFAYAGGELLASLILSSAAASDMSSIGSFIGTLGLPSTAQLQYAVLASLIHTLNLTNNASIDILTNWAGAASLVLSNVAGISESYGSEILAALGLTSSAGISDAAVQGLVAQLSLASGVTLTPTILANMFTGISLSTLARISQTYEGEIVLVIRVLSMLSILTSLSELSVKPAKGDVSIDDEDSEIDLR